MTKKIIKRGEPKPFRIGNENGKACGIVLCDHASSRIPESLDNLGVGKADLKRHIAFDIGAGVAALQVAKRLGMPAVLAEYSRLAVDLNRAPEHDECMPEASDGTPIPGNAALTKAARGRRLDELYWPYHDEIERRISAHLRKKKKPFLVSVHSMTQQLNGGAPRPWHLAVLWNKESALAKQVVRNLRRMHPELLVGENEPYSMKGARLRGSTLWRHAEERGLPCVLVEFRQDLIATPAQARIWADVFSLALLPVVKDL